MRTTRQTVVDREFVRQEYYVYTIKVQDNSKVSKLLSRCVVVKSLASIFF